MKIDWKLKGSNLLRFGCGKDTIVHPETCSGMVLMGHNNNKSLADWITSDSTLETKGSLIEWLTAYYAATVDVAQNDTPNPLTHHAGIIYPSEGLHIIDDAGGLAVAPASNDTFGGIKLGYTDINNTRRVQLDSSGNAFVSVDNISVDNYLQDWNGIVTQLSPRVYIDSNDVLGNLDLNTYLANFRDYYDTLGVPDWHKMYLVRPDKAGRLYAYVNWENTTYYAFEGTSAGLVPNANTVSSKATKYLNANGQWATPTNTTYGTFTTTENGLVPKSTTNASKFLKGDGTWATPENTTYSTANHDNPEGLLDVLTTAPDSTAEIADNSESETTFDDYFIPVVYNSDSKCHGVSLKLIVDTIINTPEILAALKAALEQ